MIKFPKLCSCSRFISATGRVKLNEPSELDGVARYLDLGNPPAASGVPADTSVARGVVALQRAVLGVSPLVCDPEVIKSVVRRIAVNVVNMTKGIFADQPFIDHTMDKVEFPINRDVGVPRPALSSDLAGPARVEPSRQVVAGLPGQVPRGWIVIKKFTQAFLARQRSWVLCGHGLLHGACAAQRQSSYLVALQ